MAFKKFTDEEKKEYAKKKNEEFQKTMEEIKQIFIQKLEEGSAPWQKGWIPTPPINFTNKSYYQGHNVLLLNLFGQIYADKEKRAFDPRFCTPKAAFKNGWKFDKEKGRKYHVYYNAPKLVPLKEKEIEKINLETHKLWLDEEKTVPGKIIFVSKHHELYNIANLSGEDLPEFTETYNISPNGNENWNKGEEIEKLLEELDVEIRFGGSKAYYSYFSDSITMPLKETFKSEEAYYGTLLHELCHWTGHGERLNRELNKTVLQHSDRAKEEVIAEMASYILCCHFGIRDPRSEEDRKETLAYTQSWLKTFSKEDKIKAYDEAIKETNKIFNFITKHLQMNEELKETEENSDNYKMAM